MSANRFTTTYKRKKQVPPPATLPAPDDWIARNASVSFIAHRCKPDRVNMRTFRSKVNGNIQYAINKGMLDEDYRGFIFRKLIAWAKQKKFYAHGLVDVSYPQIATIEGILPAMFGDCRAIQLPISIEDCHRAIVDADRAIANLEKRFSEARAQLEAQRPMVEKYMKLKVPKPKKKSSG